VAEESDSVGDCQKDSTRHRRPPCEAHKLLEEISEATIDGTRKEHMELPATVLLIIDDQFESKTYRGKPAVPAASGDITRDDPDTNNAEFVFASFPLGSHRRH
jgi:predicted AAA+ superfamily ATPase